MKALIKQFMKWESCIMLIELSSIASGFKEENFNSIIYRHIHLKLNQLIVDQFEL